MKVNLFIGLFLLVVLFIVELWMIIVLLFFVKFMLNFILVVLLFFVVWKVVKVFFGVFEDFFLWVIVVGLFKFDVFFFKKDLVRLVLSLGRWNFW